MVVAGEVAGAGGVLGTDAWLAAPGTSTLAMEVSLGARAALTGVGSCLFKTVRVMP